MRVISQEEVERELDEAILSLRQTEDDLGILDFDPHEMNVIPGRQSNAVFVSGGKMRKGYTR
jgi:hypothetical protein